MTCSLHGRWSLLPHSGEKSKKFHPEKPTDAFKISNFLPFSPRFPTHTRSTGPRRHGEITIITVSPSPSSLRMTTGLFGEPESPTAPTPRGGDSSPELGVLIFRLLSGLPSKRGTPRATTNSSTECQHYRAPKALNLNRICWVVLLFS